jgi:hypothetical protein
LVIWLIESFILYSQTVSKGANGLGTEEKQEARVQSRQVQESERRILRTPLWFHRFRVVNDPGDVLPFWSMRKPR